MKLTTESITGDPRHTRHRDLGGGWHLLHNRREGLATLILDPTGEKFDFSQNPYMSKELALDTINAFTDATPEQKRLYLDMLEGKHLKGKGAAK